MATDLAIRPAPGRVGRRYSAALREQILATPDPWVARDAHMLGNSLTPAVLTSLLVERNEGNLQGWCDLANDARRKDPHLHSQLAIREQSVVETEFEILPGKDADKRGRKKAAKDAVAACRELEEEWKRQGLETWCAEWVASKYYGRSCHEVLWERVEGLTRPVALANVEARRLSYACDRYDPDPWALRIWDQEDSSQPRYGYKVAEFHPDKFLVHEPRVAGGPKSAEGLFAVVVWYWLFRTWSWRELMALAEMIGRPPVVAYFAAGGARSGRINELNGGRNASGTEIATATKAVRGLSGALRAVLPDTIRLEALNFSIPTGEPMQLMTSREVDALVSKAVNGVANLSDLQPGARAAVEAQERTSLTFWRADCRAVERLKTELYRRFIRANPDRFGAECPVPQAKAKTDPPKDRVATLDAIERAQKVGLVVAKAWAHAATDIPEPQEGEPVLAAPKPPAPDPAALPGAESEDEPPPEATPEAPRAKE